MDWLYLVGGILLWVLLFFLLEPSRAPRPIKWLAGQQIGQFATVVVLALAASWYSIFFSRQFGWNDTLLMVIMVFIPIIYLSVSLYLAHRKTHQNKELDSDPSAI